MALERPIVTVAAVEEQRKLLRARQMIIEQKLAELDTAQKAWKSKLPQELLAEYDDIKAKLKKQVKIQEAFLKEREAFRAKALIAGLSPKLLDGEGKADDKRDRKSLASPAFFVQPLPHPGSRPAQPKKPDANVWIAPLSGLEGEAARRKKLMELQTAQLKKIGESKVAHNNFMSPRTGLKPLDRVPTFLGGGAAKVMQPSQSEKQLIPEGSKPCAFPPSSRSLKIRS